MEAAMGESTDDAVDSSNSRTSAGDCRSDVRLNGEINGSCEDNVDMCGVISHDSAHSKLLSDIGGDSNHSVLSNSALVEENGNAHSSDSDEDETMDVPSDISDNRIQGESEELAREGEVTEDCGSLVGVDDDCPEPCDQSFPSPVAEDPVKVGTAETSGEVRMEDLQGPETDVVAGMGDDSRETCAALREDVSRQTGTAWRDSEHSVAGESGVQVTGTAGSVADSQETERAGRDDSCEASAAERDVSPETVNKDADTDILDRLDVKSGDVENCAISKATCGSADETEQSAEPLSDVCSGGVDKEGTVSHEVMKQVCKSTVNDDGDNDNAMDVSAAEEDSSTVKSAVCVSGNDVDNITEMDSSSAAAVGEDSSKVNIEQPSSSDKADSKLEDTPGKIKKPRKSSTPLNVTPRRSSRNLSKTQKLYSEHEEDPDIEEITPQDPLADPLSGDVVRDKESSKPRVSRNKTTIVVNDTKRLVEIAAGSKPSKGGKKEPTLVIIDTNSILSGRGPIPVSQSVQSSSNSPAPGYSMLPMALPAQGLYPSSVTPSASSTGMPNPLRTSTPIATISQSRSPSQILPSLTDDMYVVEAPSFIVPYVYEKPPIKHLKEFVEGMAKEIEKLKEELKASEANDSEESEQEKSEKMDTSKDADGEKRDSPKEETDKQDDDKSLHTNSSGETKSLSEQGVVANGEDTDHNTQKESSESSKQTKKSDTEELKNEVKPTDVNGDISVETDRKDESKVDDKEKGELSKAEPTKPLTYFDNPLGKFFMQIGVNLVQEFVQTDLLRSQKKKRDREGGKGASVTQFAISSLLKNLELSKENNEPFHLNLKKCEYCNFKTESALVMAQHLETPHMKNYVYRCNFCTLEVRSPHDILFHMEAEHNVRGRLERAPAFHQCPNCPFEDNQKGKLSRHLLSCLKKFKSEKNQEPSVDWEPPAKIPRVSRNRPATMGIAYQALSGKQVPQHPLLPKLVPSPQMSSSASNSGRGRGRPPLHSRYLGDVGKIPVQRPIAPTQIRQSMLYRSTASGSPMLVPTTYQISGNQIYQVVGAQGQMMPVMSSGITPVPRIALMPSASTPSQSASSSSASATAATPVALVPSNAITIQNAHKNNPTAKLLQQPSISITPLPRQPATMTPPNSGLKQATTSSGGKATFVICEICDGYIKDLEQLRNHMQWIHKVKIHPKMIYNRPPLNCQKCQFRFFTDQGLERHLLGSHGLVTSSMQEAANKGKDGGRCPVCGRVYQWKLLNHVARDHNMTLKPAHLSYKCTVCTATFGMYKQFENHVYSAHSVVAKRVMDKKTTSPNQQSQRPQGATGDSLLKPLKINDEITIIPQPARPRPGPASRTGAVSAAAQAASNAKVWQCDDCEATFDGPTGFAQFTAHVKRRHLRRCSVRLCRLDACPTCKRRHVTGAVLEWLRERSGVDVIELSDDEVVIGQGRSEITITKVSCAPGPKRFKQRLQQAKVQVIEIEDSPVKATASEENGEDSLTAVKERLRRRKSLEISQIDSDGSPQVAEDLPSKKRRKIGDD